MYPILLTGEERHRIAKGRGKIFEFPSRTAQNSQVLPEGAPPISTASRISIPRAKLLIPRWQVCSFELKVIARPPGGGELAIRGVEIGVGIDEFGHVLADGEEIIDGLLGVVLAQQLPGEEISVAVEEGWRLSRLCSPKALGAKALILLETSNIHL